MTPLNRVICQQLALTGSSCKIKSIHIHYGSIIESVGRIAISVYESILDVSMSDSDNRIRFIGIVLLNGYPSKYRSITIRILTSKRSFKRDILNEITKIICTKILLACIEIYIVCSRFIL